MSLREHLAPETECFRTAWDNLIVQGCKKHAIWDSPFVQALESEDLELAFNLASVWATNMVLGSYCFPRYVGELAARAEQDFLRHGLFENAWDESGGHHHTSRSHFWLAVKLVRLLGLSDSEIERIQPLSEARAYTDEHFRMCSKGNFEQALGMICLIEEFTTTEFSIIFRALLRSCKQIVGMEPEEFVLGGGAEYFTANIADDERHRMEMPDLVRTLLADNGVDIGGPVAVIQDALSGIHKGVRRSLDLREQFFRGIHSFVARGGIFRDLVK